MTSSRPTVRRRFLAGLVPLLLALGVLPLMAPTCGTMGPGDKTFARLSLVIPMDLCYQYTTDEVSGTSGYPVNGCPQGSARGDVIKAYGLVYRLVRAGVPVYWVIANGKSAVDQIDMSIQFNGGPPVMSFDWAANNMSATARPTAGSKIDYRGGPFVIDASDFKAAQKVFLDYGKTFSVVNVHVANVAFTGHVAKVMAGGWSAGGTVPPKLALLDIGSSGAVIAENSENVIQGYLKRAGLDTADAGGKASGTHGQIYDTLVMDDIVSSSGDWTATNFYKNGYKILWIPHWSAPTSCSDCTVDYCPCTNKYSSTTVAKALANIGAFFNAGNDVFAECAGLGSLEGVFSGDTSHFQSAYGSGNAATHFQTGTTTTPAGLWSNMWGGGTVQDAVLLGQYDSPLMQLGDYPFKALNGAIADFKPAGNPATYRSGVTRYISYKNDTTYDVFTMLPGVTGGHGAAVYLGGHSYDGKDTRTGAPGAYEVAGERLVLNTLFNLGAGCVSTGQACSTGLLGECAVGAMQCNAQGELVCNQVHASRTEVCDGKDNDCNGMVDDELDEGCYEGPDGTADVGICRTGVKSCILKSDGTYGMSACTGQVLPDLTESCNGLDDTCRGHADQVQNGSGVWTSLTQPCYDGGPQTLDPVSGEPRGVCKAGLATCAGGTWGACQVCEDLYPTDSPPPWQNRNAAKYASCQILPELQQSCSYPTLDMTCSGSINASCGCTGAAPKCYDGPSNTLNADGTGKGICHQGTRACVGSSWGTCTGQVTPAPRDCTNGKDNDCNGIVDANEPACQSACPSPGSEALICRVPAVPRYTTDCANGTQLPPCTKHVGDPMGMCADGTRECTNGSFSECAGLMLPAPEICDGKDNNCDGRVDENPDTLCAPTFTCKRGVCVPAQCGAEALCPLGWDCNDASGTCTETYCTDPDDTGAPKVICGIGEACQNWQCVNPCDPVTGPHCAPGSACSGGHCVGGGCYLSGCPIGETCSEGLCVADPCSRQTCPSGTFCRAGDCVQSCVYQTCAEGQICGADGFCGADPCLPNPCTGGDVCVNDNGTAACVQDKCAGLSCGPRQLCDPTTGKCKDDPCNAVSCPVGACSKGQCYSVAKPDTSKPGTNTTTESGSAPGCGCGQGSASPLAALLLLFLVPLARRRSRAAAPLAGVHRSKAGRTTLLTLLALVALTAQACSKGGGSSSSSTVDLSKCHETCGEQRCIDVNFDPAHCGGCANVCDAGQVCKDGGCGPSGAVAPFLRTIEPTTGSPGLIDPVDVTLTGDRFDPGATVRVISPTGSAPLVTHYDEGTGQLHAELNLYDIGPTALQLRVVNPDHVISNALTFSVESVGATISDVQPRSVAKGSSAVLRVDGDGFTPTSECFHTGGTNGIPMATTVHTGSGVTWLTCTFDATTLEIGNYELWVVNDQTASSAHFQYVAVQSAQPQLLSVSPSTGTMDAAGDILLVGSGFDTTSQAVIAWPAPVSRTDTPATTFVDSTHLLVARYVPPHATTSPVSGSITVRNGSKVSGAQPFSAVSSAPTLVTMTASPFVGSTPQAGAPIYQGDKVRITFTWNNPDTATKITVTGPDGTIYPALTPTPTTSTTTAYADVTLSTGGTAWPQGSYGATVTFGSSAGTSASYSFRVLSNVAVLRSIDPAGGQQGTTVNPLGLSVANANLHGTSSTVLFKGPLPARTTVRSVTLPAGATSIALKLATDAVPSLSYDTGTYTISVQNPGAAVSNEVSFTVLPGQPSISGLSVNGAASTKTACVVQSQTATSIVVNGTNFAKPDAQGRGGSQLMYTEYPVTAQSTWAPVDASVYTVASSTQISAPAFDTRNALAGHTYQLSVWNAPGPMKSTDVVTLKVAASSCP